MPPISANELRPGDVLLYHGEALLSKLIRLFDGGRYNHAALFDGASMVEAGGGGVVRRSLGDKERETPYVHVFRFRTASGIQLGDAALPAGPVLARATHHVQIGERYAFEQIVMLALLATTRKLPTALLPGIGQIVRAVLESAMDLLADIVAAGREPMICSELVYRCFAEAGDAYRPRILGADLAPFSSAHAASILGAQEFDDSETSVDTAEVRVLAAAFLARYATAKGQVQPAAWTAADLHANPNFVTPHDLETSPNLEKVGRLVL